MARSGVRVLKAGLAYCGLVLGAGFVLGCVRVPVLVPRLGERISELIEAPFMLAVIWIAARWVTRRFAVPPRTAVRASVGILSLSLMLALELLLAAVLQGRSPGEYVASRDPVSGSVYLGMLLLFALMPVLVAPGDRARSPAATTREG